MPKTKTKKKPVAKKATSKSKTQRTNTKVSSEQLHAPSSPSRLKRIGRFCLKAIIGILIIIFLMWIIWAVDKEEAPAIYTWRLLRDGETTCSNARICIKVDEAKTGNYGFGSITGRAINNTGKRLSYAQISFGLYKEETKTGSCFANVNYLDAKGTWSFNAVCTDSGGGDTYKVEDISYW